MLPPGWPDPCVLHLFYNPVLYSPLLDTLGFLRAEEKRAIICRVENYHIRAYYGWTYGAAVWGGDEELPYYGCEPESDDVFEDGPGDHCYLHFHNDACTAIPCLPWVENNVTECGP